MSMEVIVQHKQTLLDIAMQTTGTAESVFELADRNGISITDALIVGEPIVIPNRLQHQNEKVKEIFKRKNTIIVTG